MFKASSLPCRRALDFLDDSNTIDQLAKDSGFFKRQSRKVTPAAFVKGVLLAGASGSPSFSSIAWQTGKIAGETSTHQNIHRRCKEPAVGFMQRVITHALLQQCPVPPVAATLFKRLLLNDGSVVPLADAVAGKFPASPNPPYDKAMLRLQFAYDYLSGETLFAGLDPYTRTDAAAAGDLIGQIEPGDLCLRDLGYYKARWFQQMDAAGAFYISRLKSEVLVSTDGGDPVRLDKFLTDRQPSIVDLPVRLGRKGDFQTRLVAMRVPGKVAAERRRKLREDYRRRGHTVSDRKLALSNWVLLITNLPKEQVGARILRDLYRLRWHVEIVFKTLKSSGCMRRLASHVSNESHLRVMLLGQLLQVILNLRLWRALSELDPAQPPSVLKMAGRLIETLVALWLSGPCELQWTRYLERLHRQCRYDRRALKNLENIRVGLLR